MNNSLLNNNKNQTNNHNRNKTSKNLRNKNYNLKIIHWNCFKMTENRAKELNEFIKLNKPDVISLNEVKLNNEKANALLSF